MLLPLIMTNSFYNHSLCTCWSFRDGYAFTNNKVFKIYLPIKNKLFKYDGAVNSGLTPTNYNPFLIVGYAHLDASIPDTVQTQVNVSFTSQMRYQDA